MRKPFAFEFEGNQYTLSDCVEICAVGVAENLFKKEKEVEEIIQECKILNSLSSALMAIKK